MRFSIRHVLLLVPSFLVSVFIAFAILNPKPLVHPEYSYAANDVRWLKSRADTAEVFGDRRLTIDEVDRWLAGEATPEVDEIMYDRRLDPWERPYRCVAIDEGGREGFGIYTTGRDGVSKTDGNDPDDLNSWTNADTRWYERDWVSRQRAWAFGLGLLLTPIFHPFVSWFLRALLGDSRRSRSDRDPL